MSKNLALSRRMMVSALLISILGNRILDGSEDSLVAAGTLAGIWIVFSVTLGRGIEFFFPLYAGILKKYSPTKTLIFEDGCEAFLSLLISILAFIYPENQYALFIAYMVIQSFLYPISDIASEFYSSTLAQKNAEEAYKFNASLESGLSLIGFIIAAPLGAFLAVYPVWVILIINTVVSLVSAITRMRSYVIEPVGAILEVDDSEFSMLGERSSVKKFLHDIFASGVASPVINLLLNVAGVMSGQLLLIWIAISAQMIPSQAMAITICVFGIAASIGPIASLQIAKKISIPSILQYTSLATIVMYILMVLIIANAPTGNIRFVACLMIVFICALLSRARLTALTTYRQIQFKGSQYSRIMSWSFTFSAIGSILGVNIAYALDILKNPIPSLIVVIALWVVIACVLAKPVNRDTLSTSDA